MRVTRIVAATLGGMCSLSGLSSKAIAAFQFTDVFDDGVTSNPNGVAVSGATGAINNVTQVVVGNNGDIAVLGAAATDTNPGSVANAGNVSIFYHPSGSTASVVAEVNGSTTQTQSGPAPAGGGSTVQWGDLNNLSVSSNSSGTSRLTFVGVGPDQTTRPSGLFQYDYNPANSGLTRQRVLYQGDTYPSSGSNADFLVSANDGSAPPTIPYTVNAKGKAVFGVKGNSTNYLAQGDGTSLKQVATQSAAISGFNDVSNLVSTPAGQAVFLAPSGTAAGVYVQTPGSNGAPTLLADATTGVLATDGQTYVPLHVYGANGSNVLMLGKSGGNAAFILEKIGVADTFTVLGSAFPFTGTQAPQAVISPGGKIVVEQPNTTDGTTAESLKYFDANSLSTNNVATISLTGTITRGTTTYTYSSIAATAPNATSPMIDDAGQIVYGVTFSDNTQAFLTSTPQGGGAQQPSFVIATGDTATIGGAQHTVTGLFDNSPVDKVGGTQNTFSGALNSNGLFAFGVNYDTGVNVNGSNFTGVAVLSTPVAVPEPSALALAGMAALPALSLRRRRRSRSS